MKYFSTRGAPDIRSFEDVVLAGLAPDGGLYIPDHIPPLPSDWQSEWSHLSYQDLAVEILSLFIPSEELSPVDLKALVYKTYDFPQKFRREIITPLVELDSRTYVLELFHGPTYAFKDLALQLVGNLFEFFLSRRNSRKSPGEKAEKLTVVGATSGDTGSAAIYGLRNKANISIFILFPKGRVSPIQEAQMTTVSDTNVHNLAVKGTFDDCQDILKNLLADKEFNAKHNLGAVNSINWARILAQIVYYFSAFFQLQRILPANEDSEIQFVVPTGNFGDILAGYYAKRLGLPMGKLGVATNANDILTRFWKTGRYEKFDSMSNAGTEDVQATLSPAMDIAVSSNFERLLWYLAYEASFETEDSARRTAACSKLNGWMTEVKQRGKVDLQDVLPAAQRDFVAERVDDGQTLEAIREQFNAPTPYVSDPHTAVGLYAAKALAATNPPSVVQVVLSTAHPAKFSAAVTRALASSPVFNFERDVLPLEFHDLLTRERRVEEVEKPDVELVKAVIEKFTEVR
ncbi:tryptophan synthase beta subunit-like PLP-dependent enzyme [Phlebopus sp. FC_14]|nr:tryptophan synthase beta subunit-like PLP-dependent enzyme [Phlebopus sp. FC_14]